MRHIMIDNENIPLRKIPDLGTEPCQLWLFTGNRQDKLPTELTQDLLKLQSDSVHNVNLITVNQTGDNALDFCLTYKMGQITKEYAAEDICFCVFSKDRGFDSVILHMLEHEHCAYAVRVSEEKYLALSEEALRQEVRPPELKSAFTPFRPSYQGTAYFVSMPPKEITISMGTKEAWQGLQTHPEARARHRHNLAIRLREFVLKEWLTQYPNLDHHALVEDIIERLVAQGSISIDPETGLLTYNFEYMTQVDSVMAKLYEWIERNNPKPPQTQGALANWLKINASRFFQITPELIDTLIQITIWRGILSISSDQRVAYRKHAPKAKPYSKANPNKDKEWSLNRFDATIFGVAAMVYEHLFQEESQAHFNRESLGELCLQYIFKTDYAQGKAEAELQDMVPKIIQFLQNCSLIVLENEQVMPQEQMKPLYESLILRMCRNVFGKQNAPRTYGKLLNQFTSYRTSPIYGSWNMASFVFALNLCIKRGYLSISLEDNSVTYHPLPPELVAQFEQEEPKDRNQEVVIQIPERALNQAASASVEASSITEAIWFGSIPSQDGVLSASLKPSAVEKPTEALHSEAMANASEESSPVKSSFSTAEKPTEALQNKQAAESTPASAEPSLITEALWFGSIPSQDGVQSASLESTSTPTSPSEATEALSSTKQAESASISASSSQTAASSLGTIFKDKSSPFASFFDVHPLKSASVLESMQSALDSFGHEESASQTDVVEEAKPQTTNNKDLACPMSPEELWHYARRYLTMHHVDDLPKSDKSLIMLLQCSGLSKKDAEQAVFMLIRKQNIAVHFEGGVCRIAYLSF